MAWQLQVLRCSNCGMEWTLPDTLLRAGPSGPIACPVCGFRETLDDYAPLEHTLTTDELETELMHLISEARASGVALDEIVELLSREIEFNMAMAHTRHHCLVQVIDLGELESELQPPRRPAGLHEFHSEGFSG